jgi:hypothetical protein
MIIFVSNTSRESESSIDKEKGAEVLGLGWPHPGIDNEVEVRGRNIAFETVKEPGLPTQQSWWNSAGCLSRASKLTMSHRRRPYSGRRMRMTDVVVVVDDSDEFEEALGGEDEHGGEGLSGGDFLGGEGEAGVV